MIHTFYGRQLNEIYYDLLTALAQAPNVSPRGLPTRELSPCLAELSDPTQNIITLPGFETNIDYAKKELKWYISGSNKLTGIHPYEKVLVKYSDDGVTLNSAYGYMIFGNHPQVKIDQFDWCARKLAEDTDTRQAVININLPAHKWAKTKDFPCTVFLQFLVRFHRLDLFTAMRSNDIFYGLRNDAYCFTELQKIMLSKLRDLGVRAELGRYFHYSTSIHVYEQKWRELHPKFLQLLKVGGNIFGGGLNNA